MIKRHPYLTYLFITKSCLYNFDPFKPHFYKVKLGFAGLYVNCLISDKKKHRLWILEAVLTSTHNLYFKQKYEKKIRFFLSENSQFLQVNFSVYLNRRVFLMFLLTCYPKSAYVFITNICLYISFLISVQKHILWVLVRTASPRRF